MKIFLHFILYSVLLLFVAATVSAETRYISDQLIVTVRSGKGNQYKILESLPTSTPVTVLEEDKDYVKVLTKKGTEGYIRRHYVSKSLPKKIQIRQLKKEIATSQQLLETQQQSFQTCQNELSDSENRMTELSAQLNQARQALEEKEGEYNTLMSHSENVLNLDAENKQLAEENNTLSSELLVLREENQNFHRSNMIQWFLAGAGVFFGGWLIGKISRRKQRRF
ncbi:MAG: TIGR04211 family SH3 domain-containing protein [Desulfuromusa sp.]|nr:TIGR04211 family SH3 domain-containing protein [Desulfuromusa sp.]